MAPAKFFAHFFFIIGGLQKFGCISVDTQGCDPLNYIFVSTIRTEEEKKKHINFIKSNRIPQALRTLSSPCTPTIPMHFLLKVGKMGGG